VQSRSFFSVAVTKLQGEYDWHNFLGAYPLRNPVFMDNTPSGLRNYRRDAVEIRTWEIYFTRSRNNMLAVLNAYSLEKTPGDNSGLERLTFRFLRSDWERTLKPLFSALAIPYENVRTFKTELTPERMKKKIYIAEDDLNILFALDTMLEEAGYDVVPFHCGAPMLQENLPAADLFIVDKLMPDVDGLEVCRHLKNRPETKDVPVIMMSALRNFKKQALSEGADDFLEKPFQRDALLKLVAKHTQKSTDVAYL
jgi:CheY-like chemotaxis protein